jgi:predicted ABC-type ATPase
VGGEAGIQKSWKDSQRPRHTVNRLDLVAGPDGAGKSTFVARTLAPLLKGSVFVNADEIAEARWPDGPPPHADEAALIAAQTRDKLIEDGRSFIAETVFSHPSELELIDAAHAAGYTVVLHVLLIPEQLAVSRVVYRVQAGGHPVAQNKIRERYHRLWALVADAMTRCEQATVYDNSGIKGPRIVAQMSGGFIVGSPDWPDGTPRPLQSRWPNA